MPNSVDNKKQEGSWMPARKELSSPALLAASCGRQHRPAAGWDAGQARGGGGGGFTGGAPAPAQARPVSPRTPAATLPMGFGCGHGSPQALAAAGKQQGWRGGEGTPGDHDSMGRAQPGAAFRLGEVYPWPRASRAPAEPLPAHPRPVDAVLAPLRPLPVCRGYRLQVGGEARSPRDPWPGPCRH